eukprot:7094539-Pyramimonas_sp.AAC.1
MSRISVTGLHVDRANALRSPGALVACYQRGVSGVGCIVHAQFAVRARMQCYVWLFAIRNPVKQFGVPRRFAYWIPFRSKFCHSTAV